MASHPEGLTAQAAVCDEVPPRCRCRHKVAVTAAAAASPQSIPPPLPLPHASRAVVPLTGTQLALMLEIKKASVYISVWMCAR